MALTTAEKQSCGGIKYVSLDLLLFASGKIFAVTIYIYFVTTY